MPSAPNLKQFIEWAEDALSQLTVPEWPAGLYQPVEYMMGLGGKRLRPVLSLMAGYAMNGDRKAAYPAARAVELFHNFTLMHDDLMDSAPLRRGKTTVHKRWNDDTAILSGDVMFVLAYKELLNVPDEHLRAGLTLFGEVSAEVCEGQQLDMEYEGRTDVSLQEYLKMIELKTAALVDGSLGLGALLSGGRGDVLLRLRSFGRALGISFQIRDDLLDAFGSPDSFGKQVGGDILSNKKTWLSILCRERAQVHPDLHNKLDALLEEEDPDIKVQGMKNLFSQLKVEDSAREKAEEYYQLSLRELKACPLAPDRIAPLLELAQYLQSREQ